jgi:hypothetical protein
VQKPFKSEAPLLLEVFNAVFQDLQPEALLSAKQVHTRDMECAGLMAFCACRVLGTVDAKRRHT